jgi:hypothetical protein
MNWFGSTKQIIGPLSASGNFSADLLGQLDTRPGTWGNADVRLFDVTFQVPKGYRVRVLRTYGDFLAWPKGAVPSGKAAGVLFGLQTTAPEGSARIDWMADNTFLFVCTATNGTPVRAPFDFDTSAGGLLEPDHILRLKVASWLNDTGLEIHMEPTLTIVYQYEIG